MNDFLTVTGVCKYFGKLSALNDIGFSVKRGERVGLIGPNGAGKTTLFNVLTGFYRTDSGTIVFDETDVTRFGPNRLAEMGMVRTFQIPRPFKELTVHDNVAIGTLFNPRRTKSKGISAESAVRQILNDIGLESVADQLAGNLGYGNLKLLELGRAQGTQPELLLLDEPFAGLTLHEIETISALIKRLAEQGLTLIIVEHKLKELMKLVDRVIVLHYGEKIADGPPDVISQDEQVLRAYLGRRWRGGDA